MLDFDLYIIDDEPEMGQLISDIADSLGIRTKIFVDPLQAWMALQTVTPRAIVLDLAMPNMDGVEFIKKMAESGYTNVSIVLVSGKGSSVLHACKGAAADRSFSDVQTLDKPFHVKSMHEILKGILERNSAPEISSVKTRQKYHIADLAADGKIVTYYQPKIDLRSGEILGFEALVRCDHLWLGLVEPDSFIPEAEKNGTIVDISRAVIEDVFNNLKFWNAKKNYTVAINLSPLCVTGFELPKLLEDLAEKHDINPKNIAIELTETAVMQELVDAVEALSRLRLKGFKLSLDDFGTGFSSMSKLHQIPFNELKIDQSFVAESTASAESKAIAETSILLAHRLGMECVAEGLETKEQYELMRSLGCDAGQGFIIGRPMPPEDISAWESEWNTKTLLSLETS